MDDRLELVNLTAHPVQLLDEDRQPIAVWKPSGLEARLEEFRVPQGHVLTERGAVPLVELSYGDRVNNLPTPTRGRGYIVSRVLAAAVARADLFFPFLEIRTGGQIIGCGGLAQFSTAPAGRSRC